MYNEILFTNILRLLDERGMTKNELAEKADISNSFLSDLTNGIANPSLKIMEAIADALETPLASLLEHTDLDPKALDTLAGGKARRNLPEGYTRLSAVLPDHQAFIVRKWDEAARKKLREQS
jgi:transcriptional regulator with XRE-family HTH domain